MSLTNNVYCHYFTKPTAYTTLQVFCYDDSNLTTAEANSCFNLIGTFLQQAGEIDDDFLLFCLN